MKVYWGSSVGRGYDPDHVDSIVGLLGHSRHQFYWKPLSGDALIERSRSRSATRFLDSDADVFVSVDTDIIFNYADLDTIIDQAITHDIVVGAYVTRSPIHTFPTSLVTKDTPITFSDDPTPVPINWGATGFMAVHRRVFETLVSKGDLPLCHPHDSLRHRPFYLPFITADPAGDPIMLSEDFAFCERARRAGFTTYLNPAVRLGHLGPYCYRLEDMALTLPQAQPLTLTRLSDDVPPKYRVEPFDPAALVAA